MEEGADNFEIHSNCVRKLSYLKVKVKCVIFGDFEMKQVHVMFKNAALTRSPHPKLASELQWPEHSNPDNLLPFFFVGLNEDKSVYSKYETRCQVASTVANVHSEK